MNIKVAAFTVSEKSINNFAEILALNYYNKLVILLARYLKMWLGAQCITKTISNFVCSVGLGLFIFLTKIDMEEN